jgi:stage III sporulation protein AH
MRWREGNVARWLLVCLAVLLVSALYLRNQQLAKNNNSTLVPEKEITESQPLKEPSSDKAQPEPRRQDFYVEQRLDRDRVRSQEMDTLREIIHNQTTDEQNRKEAHARLLYLSEEMAKEVEVEALVKAKGFQDALVYLHPNSVHIIVKAVEITADEAACIGDIVVSSTSLPLEKVIIDTRP